MKPDMTIPFLTGRRIIRTAVILALPGTFCACGTEDVLAEMDGAKDKCVICLDFRCGDGFATKVQEPAENRISDISIFLFNDAGQLEEQAFLKGLNAVDGHMKWSSEWLEGTECRIYACANFGFGIKGISSVGDIEKFRYHLAYPDEYSRGIPMSGKTSAIISGKGQTVDIPLERLMSRISIRIDRSKLDKDVKFNVRSVQIKGAPRSVGVFGDSRASGSADVFGSGFIRNMADADGLNIDSGSGISREINLYMLENMQGDLLPDITGEREMVLDTSDVLASVCSHIELKAEYISGTYYSRPEEYLVYRFYLGEKPGNFDIRRNCCYSITVQPAGSGLDGVGWRVDRSGLESYGGASESSGGTEE